MPEPSNGRIGSGLAVFCVEPIGFVRTSDAKAIKGSGVDVDVFCPSPRPERVPTVILVARMLWDKGVGDCVRAAELLKAEGVAARFVLVGVPDAHIPTAVDVAQLRAWEKAGIVEWLGMRYDIPDLLAEADIACLPTYYREGLPKTLLEAMASGLPLVATDVIGCREAVEDGVNGLLVAPRDPAGLAARAASPDRRPRLARKDGRRRPKARALPNSPRTSSTRRRSTSTRRCPR